MADDANKANEFARRHFGAEVDAAAGAPGFKVLTPTDGDGGPPKKPFVELPGNGNRNLADFATDLGRVFAEAPIFRREEVVVTVEPNTGEMKLMSPERFLTWVSDHAVIFEDCEVGPSGKRAKVRYQRTMPLTTAKGVLASDHFYYQVRPLVRVNTVRMPVMSEGRPRLLPEGYDPESQIFTIKSPVQIDEKVTLDKAKLFFKDIYGEFGFTDERSFSVALTIPLSLWGIGLQSVEAARMGFMVRANTQGGGKSLIAQMGITPSYGLPENTAKAKEDELRKILDAAVLQAVPYLFFDNLKGHFENALVEGFMTTPVWRARVMGTQRFMRGKVCSVLIITGNNLTVSPDLQRRLLQCDVFVEEFDLQEKEHKRDINPVMLNKPDLRGEFLSALWALVRNWYELARPPAGTREKPYRVATFAEWSDIFGGIIQAAGYGNPLLPPKDDQVAAPLKRHQQVLIELLAHDVNAKQHTKEFTFQELIDCCVDNELFGWRIKGRMREPEGKKEYFEIASDSASTMGLMFTNEMAGAHGKQRVYTMPDGRRIAFGKQGEGRGKRYTVTFVGQRST